QCLAKLPQIAAHAALRYFNMRSVEILGDGRDHLHNFSFRLGLRMQGGQNGLVEHDKNAHAGILYRIDCSAATCVAISFLWSLHTGTHTRVYSAIVRSNPSNSMRRVS